LKTMTTQDRDCLNDGNFSLMHMKKHCSKLIYWQRQEKHLPRLQKNIIILGTNWLRMFLRF